MSRKDIIYLPMPHITSQLYRLCQSSDSMINPAQHLFTRSVELFRLHNNVNHGHSTTIVINRLLPTIFQREDFYHRHMLGFTISGESYPSFHQRPLTRGYLSSPKYEYVPIFSYLHNVSEIVLNQRFWVGLVAKKLSAYPFLFPLHFGQDGIGPAFAKRGSIGKPCSPGFFLFSKLKLRSDSTSFLFPTSFQTRRGEEKQR